MSHFLYLVALDREGREDWARTSPSGYEEVYSGFGTLYLRGPGAEVIEKQANDIIARHGEWIPENRLDRLRDLSPEPDITWARQRGTVLRIRAEPRVFGIATDLVGSFPVYFWRSSSRDRVAVGSAMGVVRSVAGTGMDPVGAYQYVRKGYTYGTRTVAMEVEQMGAGQALCIVPDGGRLKTVASRETTLWKRTGHPGTADELLEEVSALLTEEAAKLSGSQLMLSGGWDSRTILAGVMGARKQSSIRAYSHGLTQGREVQIAKLLSERAGVRHVARAVGGDAFSPNLAGAILDETDTFLFPHWWSAAWRGRDAGFSKITAGVYGELLGGHSSVPYLASPGRRSISLLRYILGYSDPANRSIAEAEERVVELLKEDRYERIWCMTEDWHRSLEGRALESVNDDVRNCVAAYSHMGVGTVEQLVEAFVVDHRNRQYTNAQLRSAGGRLRIVNPFTNPRLLELVTGLSLSDKIHNTLNRRLLQKIAPSLARLPMAATIVPASAPILVQEFSRAGRKSLQSVAETLRTLTGNRTPQLRTGWVDFRFLRGSDEFHGVVDSLRLDIWEKDRMHDAIDSESQRMHPLFDMIAKCKTMDYHLTDG